MARGAGILLDDRHRDATIKWLFAETDAETYGKFLCNICAAFLDPSEAVGHMALHKLRGTR